jgi:FtsX extracellular domain
MKSCFLFLTLFFSISAFSQEGFSLQELVKSNWNKLARGVEYISIKKDNDTLNKKDSIEISIKGFSDDEFSSLELYFSRLSPEIINWLTPLLNQYIPDSKEGFLKVNFSELLRPDIISGKVYLKGDYNNPTSRIKDSISLQKIPGVKSVKFFSKEDAKKEYLAAGNDDWSKVLEDNPLPNSFNIELADADWTEKLLNELKDTILNKLTFASSVNFPASLFEKSNRYYYFGYKRK